MSHYRANATPRQIRSERTKIEGWWGHRADVRVKLGRHPAKLHGIPNHKAGIIAFGQTFGVTEAGKLGGYNRRESLGAEFSVYKKA